MSKTRAFFVSEQGGSSKMGSYKVEFSANVRKDFQKIPYSHAGKILGKIHELEHHPRPRQTW
jgi:hypothetical protein